MLYDQIVEKTVIESGWSEDRKYRVVTSDGDIYLLRISAIERYDSRVLEFKNMQKAAKMGLRICRPIEIGLCTDGCYELHEWIEGVDLSVLIGSYSQEKQYQLGVEAGRILQHLHQIEVADPLKFDWEEKFNQKLDQRIDRYLEEATQYEKGALMIDYIHQHRKLLHSRSIVFQHGDFHLGNMMINRRGQLVVIDFDRSDYGDPWEEFNRIVWCMAFPAFASGMIDGYFNQSIPQDFWQLLALYIVGNSIGSITWAEPYGAEQVAVIVKQAQEILEMYDDMTCEKMIPKWYQSYHRY